MDLCSILQWPTGKRSNLVSEVDQCHGPYMLGCEIPFGEKIAFRREGCPEGRMTLYNVSKSGLMLDNNESLNWTNNFRPCSLDPIIAWTSGFIMMSCAVLEVLPRLVKPCLSVPFQLWIGLRCLPSLSV